MTRWLLIALLTILPVSTIAFDLPYGIQDPMHAIGFPACAGGEIGYWQVVSRTSSDGQHTSVYLALTEVDFMDPAVVICYVPNDRRILIMEPGKKL